MLECVHLRGEIGGRMKTKQCLENRVGKRGVSCYASNAMCVCVCVNNDSYPEASAESEPTEEPSCSRSGERSLVVYVGFLFITSPAYLAYFSLCRHHLNFMV